MQPGKAFIEVLDDMLDGYRPEPASPAPRAGLGFATPSIFLFQAGLPSARREPSAAAPPPPPPPRRARRTLTALQQHALDAFARFGATLGDDFTDIELRRAFRALALQYHPDRHPDSTDIQKAHLSVRFSQLHTAYESLKSTPAN